MLVVVLVVLGFLDDIVSRTSSKQKAASLMNVHTEEKSKHKETLNR